MPDNSLNIALVVTLVPDGDAYVVQVKPLMMRYHAGPPKPEPIGENDPSVPGWATGKVDQLALSIHDALKPYEVQTLGGVTPAGPVPRARRLHRRRRRPTRAPLRRARLRLRLRP